MYDPTIYLAKPNLSFIQSSPYHILSANVGCCGIEQKKPNQGFQRPNELNLQPLIPRYGWTSLAPTRSFSTEAIKGSSTFVPTMTPGTNKSIHNLLGFHRIYPSKTPRLAIQLIKDSRAFIQ